MQSEAIVHIVDDDKAIRDSLTLLMKSVGFESKSYDSAEMFLDEAELDAPGCLIADIRMRGKSGLELQQLLNDKGIKMPVIIITGHGDVPVAVQAMKAGAIDFIEKPFAKETLLESIGEAFERLRRSSEKSKRREEAELLVNGLTPREHEVLVGLTKGHPNKTIGYDLDISPRTVEIHRANLMKKLEVYNLSDLLRIAFAAGVGEEPQADADPPATKAQSTA